MQKEMRDKLIDLLKETFDYTRGVCMDFDEAVEINADYLLANGVILLPIEVGDTVYYIEGAYYNSKRKAVKPIKVTEISWKYDRNGRDLGFALIANRTRYKFSSIGKTVFLTREAAEESLRKEQKK